MIFHHVIKKCVKEFHTVDNSCGYKTNFYFYSVIFYKYTNLKILIFSLFHLSTNCTQVCPPFFFTLSTRFCMLEK